MDQQNDLIKRLISKGQIEAALKELLSFSKGTDFHNSAIILSSSFQKLKNEDLSGISVKSQKWNKISDSILRLADEIKKEIKLNDAVQTIPEKDASSRIDVEDLNLIPPLVAKEIYEKKNQTNNIFEPIDEDYGVSKNGKGEFKLIYAPTVFFKNRFEKAFPGVRGLKWFESETAVKRLALLLKKPTRFDIADGHGLYTDPIWWFRGFSRLPVDNFDILSPDKCLLGFEELKIKRIAAYNSAFYYKSFVYVETEPDSPIGIYQYSDDDFLQRIKLFGYFREDYGLHQGIPITCNELDDGAAEIDGEVVDISGQVVHRSRYLTKYNFILVAKTSPFNSIEGEILGDEYMDAILQGTKPVEDFAKMADKLPKNRMDY